MIFDTRTCPESQLQLVMFSIMEYVTGTVQRHWARHRADAVKPGAPLFLGRSLMLIDEAWHLIRRDETGEYANDLARRARHLGLALIVMSQQLSDFNTDYGKALVRNSAQQLLLAQNPQEIPFIAETVELSEREAAELGRLKTVKGRHAQMLWLNGSRGHGKVTLRVGPTEYWAFTSDPTEVAMRDEQIAQHDGNVWAAINALARRGTRAHRDQRHGAHDRCRRALRRRRVHEGRAWPSATPIAPIAREPPESDPGRCWRFAVWSAAPARPRLAYLVALAAARQSTEPVLVADTGGPSGGLAGLAGVEAPRSLPELASHLKPALRCGDGLYAIGPAGVRVLASGPEFTSSCPHEQLERILADAREAHGLTVVDCGTLAREVDQLAVATATHIAWVVPATEQGVRSGARVLASRTRDGRQGNRRRTLRCPPAEGTATRASADGSRATGAAGTRPAPPSARRPTNRSRRCRKRKWRSRRSSERSGDERPKRTRHAGPVPVRRVPTRPPASSLFAAPSGSPGSSRRG